MPTKYIAVDGTAIHCFHTGRTTLPGVLPDLSRGRVVVFIHGAGSNGHTWHRQLAALAERHSPLAFDFPGHGRSGGTESLQSIDAYQVFLAALLDRLSVRACVLVGRSMGGAVALAHALARPDRVRALGLIATSARFTLPPALLDTWLGVMQGRLPQPFTREGFSPATDLAIVRDAWMEQIKTDPRVRYHDLVACNAFDVRARLGEIRVPTLVLAGRDDPVTPVACAAELHAGISGSALRIIDAAGHSVTSEQPAEVNAALAAFVDALS